MDGHQNPRIIGIMRTDSAETINMHTSNREITDCIIRRKLEIVKVQTLSAQF
jgi:hypothetical protein